LIAPLHSGGIALKYPADVYATKDRNTAMPLLSLLPPNAATSLLVLAQQAPGPRLRWAPVVLLLVIAIGFAVGNIVISLFIGPSRTGPGKEATYESGMVPIGDTSRRFNVRFYIVAMIFLVFDVDIIFMYPWATIFAPAVQGTANIPALGGPNLGALLLVEMFIFVGLLLLAYLYAWGKGVFRWD
jgi:NADH-quinone oxidoreductase subunit A